MIAPAGNRLTLIRLKAERKCGAMSELWRQRPRLARMLVYGSLPLVAAECLSIGLMARSVAAGAIGVASLMVYGQALAITFRTMRARTILGV